MVFFYINVVTLICALTAPGNFKAGDDFERHFDLPRETGRPQGGSTWEVLVPAQASSCFLEIGTRRNSVPTVDTGRAFDSVFVQRPDDAVAWSLDDPDTQQEPLKLESFALPAWAPLSDDPSAVEGPTTITVYETTPRKQIRTVGTARELLTITLRLVSRLPKPDLEHAPALSVMRLADPFFRIDSTTSESFGEFNVLWMGTDSERRVLTPPHTHGPPDDALQTHWASKGVKNWTPFFAGGDIDALFGRKEGPQKQWFSKSLTDPGHVATGMHAQLHPAVDGRDFLKRVRVERSGGVQEHVFLVSGPLVQSVLRHLKPHTIIQVWVSFSR